MVRRSARASASAPVSYAEADLSAGILEAKESAPTPKRTRKAVKDTATASSPDSIAQTPERTISRKLAETIVKQAASPPPTPPRTDSSDLSEEDVKPAKKKRAKAPAKEKVEPPTHFETRVNVHGEKYQIELDEEGDPVRRDKNGRRLTKRKKKDIVYEIPDVPKRDFRLEGPSEKRQERRNGFTGELGYACLNTVLRWQDPPIFSSRTARIKTMDEQGPDYIKELGRLNARDMIPMILWNEENNIKFMRLSSEVFPFASHEKYGYSLKYAEKELRTVGDLAKKLGHRLTMHPGQFTQLGSNRPEVIEASIRDLTSHCEMLDLMGMGKDSVMIIHGGGTFGDREATLNRMRETYTTRLSQNIKDRLVLENDEMAWSAEELLPLCKELDIPMVFDFHHDLLRPSSRPPSELLPEIQAIWHKKGIRPKYHLSEPRPGASNLRERRAHSDRCGFLPPDLPADAHLMIEAKDKEQAVLELYRIYNLRPVKHDSLRPPAKDIGVKTSGRKSKLGGERLPRESKKGKGKRDADEDQVDKQAAPQKLNPKSLSMAERAIAKSKEMAKRMGKVYTGPGADVGEDEGIELTALKLGEEGYVKTSEEVLKDMHMEADWVRAELQAGRERRPFGTEAGAAVDDDGNEFIDGVEDDSPAMHEDTKSKRSKKAEMPESAAAELPVLTGPQRKRAKAAMVENGQKVVLAQGAPPEELSLDHEKIPVDANAQTKTGQKRGRKRANA
ncbi:related to UV-endonuclease UVE-1 [Melanopsichium pennsylvanicum]|uniref:Related to UV-endonuclease UVE-1 n=2 Tax=Melanopsichium pennsylvanicum TaxID=63383 RepID=A0AAJ5C3R1_9BASI|nr:related to UV-endonuclease UVE-1 [Melanopsichium pennsylvanicum]